MQPTKRVPCPTCPATAATSPPAPRFLIRLNPPLIGKVRYHDPGNCLSFGLYPVNLTYLTSDPKTECARRFPIIGIVGNRIKLPFSGIILKCAGYKRVEPTNFWSASLRHNRGPDQGRLTSQPGFTAPRFKPSAAP